MENHTTLGSITTIMCMIIGHSLHWITTDLLHVHIPPIVMETAQLSMWVTGSAVGVITVHGWWKKHFKKS